LTFVVDLSFFIIELVIQVFLVIISMWYIEYVVEFYGEVFVVADACVDSDF
jgi:hypothetical protein